MGGVHGDGIREIGARLYNALLDSGTGSGAFKVSPDAVGYGGGVTDTKAKRQALFSASMVVPVSQVNRPRAWGALACVYLGQPSS